MAAIIAIARFRVLSSCDLKVKLQCELHDSRVYRSPRNHPERCRRDIRVRIRKLRMIERVEEFRSEFDVAAFAQKPHRRSLQHRDVGVVLTGTEHDSDSAVAKGSACAVIPNNRPGGCSGGIAQDAAFVEVIIKPAAQRA